MPLEWARLATVLALVAAAAPMFAAPVLAEGVELPARIRPSLSGDYVLRAVLSTNESVRGLRYSLHKVVGGGIREEIKDVARRPEVLNTRPGEKRPVVLSFKYPLSGPEELALCMYADPPNPASSGSGSRLRVAFRFCKLLTLQP
jgi:hypothetical protein